MKVNKCFNIYIKKQNMNLTLNIYFIHFDKFAKIRYYFFCWDGRPTLFRITHDGTNRWGGGVTPSTQQN